MDAISFEKVFENSFPETDVDAISFEKVFENSFPRTDVDVISFERFLKIVSREQMWMS